MVNNRTTRKGPRGARNGASKRAGGAPTPGGLPDVYQEMLVDAVSSSPTRLNEEGRTLKRRRVGGRVVTQGAEDNISYHSDHASTLAGDTHAGGSVVSTGLVHQQTAYNDSDDSADSDMDWEEVELKDGTEEDAFNDGVNDEGPMELTLSESHRERRSHGPPRRKPATAAEKKIRLEVHRMHLLSLLVHIHLRNYWCNDQEVRVHLCSPLYWCTMHC